MVTEDKIDERIKALEDEVHQTKYELGQILLDIRAFLMEALNPLKPYEGKKGAKENYERGVEEYDSRKEN